MLQKTKSLMTKCIVLLFVICCSVVMTLGLTACNDQKVVVGIDRQGDNIVITWSDGTTTDVGTIKGDKGDKGETGAQGPQGEKGETGATGNGVKDIEVNTDGTSFKVNYTDGTSSEWITLPQVGANCEHKWDSFTLVAHELGHEGKAIAICDKCGYSKFTVIAHVFDNDPVVTAPTCTTDGYTSKKCACGAASEDKYDIVAALDHDKVTNTYYLKDTGATLCEQKYQTITTCKREGCNYYVEGTLNAAKGHTYTDWTETNKPTATTDGTITRKCGVCGLSTGDKFVETLPSFNSKEGKKLIVETSENTNCLQSRNGKYTYTAQDGTKFEYSVTIPAASTHKLANGEEISLSKVYELGAKAEKGDKTYAELGFDWAGNDAQTCDKVGGQGLVKCAECGKYVVVVVKNTHANVTEVVNIESTCSLKGQKSLTCADCEESWTEDLPLREHDYKYELTGATTDKDGKVSGTLTWTCQYSDCGDTHSEKVTGLTKTTIEATCQAAGKNVYTYVKNGETLTAEETITQLPHTANVTLVAGGSEKIEIDTSSKVYDLSKYAIEVSGNSNITCADGEAQGLVDCLTCLKTFIVKVIAKHTAPAGYVYKTPTCSEQYDDFACTVCGQTVHEAVEVLKHNYTYELSNIDTVAKTAKLVKTCSVGKEVETENVSGLTSKVVREATCTVKALIRYTYTDEAGLTGSKDIEGAYASHYFADGTVMVLSGKGTVYTVGDHGIVASGNSPAVCSSTGLGLADCKVCTKTMVVDIKGSHVVNEATVDKKDPTCTKDGYYHYNCLNCSELVKDEVGHPDKYKATGHIYSYEQQTAPTKTTTGGLVGTCKTCGDVTNVELPVLSSKDYTVTAATCTVKTTYTWKVTEYGNYTFEDEEDAVASHNESKVIGTYYVESKNEAGKKVITNYKLYFCAACQNYIREIVTVQTEA